jgi:hypothetical protein
MRELDLQRALGRTGAAAEDLQDQTGAVDHLGLERFLEVALLHGRQRGVDDDEGDLVRLRALGELGELALAEIGRGADLGEADEDGVDDVEIDGARQPLRLFAARFGAARRTAVARRARGRIRADDQRSRPRRDRFLAPAGAFQVAKC